MREIMRSTRKSDGQRHHLDLTETLLEKMCMNDCALPYTNKNQISILNVRLLMYVRLFFTTCFWNLPFFSLHDSYVNLHSLSEWEQLESEIEGKESYGRRTMDSNAVHIYANGLVALVPFLYPLLLKIHYSGINVFDIINGMNELKELLTIICIGLR